MSHTRALEVNNAILGSTQNHPLIKHLIEQLALNLREVEQRQKQMKEVAAFCPELAEEA